MKLFLSLMYIVGLVCHFLEKELCMISNKVHKVYLQLLSYTKSIPHPAVGIRKFFLNHHTQISAWGEGSSKSQKGSCNVTYMYKGQDFDHVLMATMLTFDLLTSTHKYQGWEWVVVRSLSSILIAVWSGGLLRVP